MNFDVLVIQIFDADFVSVLQGKQKGDFNKRRKWKRSRKITKICYKIKCDIVAVRRLAPRVRDTPPEGPPGRLEVFGPNRSTSISIHVSL